MRPDAIADAATGVREGAFRRLADQHLEASYRLACAILGDAAEAQDATHDAFVQAWRKWSTLRDHSRFEAWFNRILVNTCRNRLKRSARWRSEELTEDVATARGDPFGQALDRQVLRAALSKLSPDHQLVIALRFYQDLSVPDIARRLNMREGTVSSRLHYAVKRLHAALDDADQTGARP